MKKKILEYKANVRKPISVTLRKIYYTKGVITRMKGVKTHLKAKKREIEMRYNANKGEILE